MNKDTEVLMHATGESPFPGPFKPTRGNKCEDWFHVFGYFEEIQEPDGTVIGTRSFPGKSTEQKFGEAGARLHTFKKGEEIYIDKGWKEPKKIVFKRDTVAYIRAQALCGKMK